MKVIVVSGKKKEAVGKAVVKEGKGIIRINKKRLETFPWLLRTYISEPIMLAEDYIKKVNINITIRGGGVKGQAEVARLLIAKGLVNFFEDDDLKATFLKYDRHLLVNDTRRKEPRKPLRSKARASKQTSYR
ncbi:MAG TPA: 30S ribosomal protein S9 [Nautiliaceae bacterium]|nr:30S ribosomal protein S9 [Nautiliaceae bacterium]